MELNSSYAQPTLAGLGIFFGAFYFSPPLADPADFAAGDSERWELGIWDNWGLWDRDFAFGRFFVLAGWRKQFF